MIYDLDSHLYLEKSRGPAYGIANPAYKIFLSYTENNVPVIIHVSDDGRYKAASFSKTGLPIEAWPRGKPLRLANGIHDRDGDGVLEKDKEGVPEGKQPTSRKLSCPGEPLVKERQ